MKRPCSASGLGTHTITRAPAVPELRTSLRARSRPAIPPERYGHMRRKPGEFGAMTWHVGTYARPMSRENASRSKAAFTARRTRTSSNGGTRVLRKK
jgi:hypothetical protein